MRRLRTEDKKILQNAKTEATNHCLNELEMRAELLDLKGKTQEAKHSEYFKVLSVSNRYEIDTYVICRRYIFVISFLDTLDYNVIALLRNNTFL